MNLFNCMKLNSLKYFCTIDVAALTLTILKVCFFFDNIQHFHSCLIKCCPIRRLEFTQLHSLSDICFGREQTKSITKVTFNVKPTPNSP